MKYLWIEHKLTNNTEDYYAVRDALQAVGIYTDYWGRCAIALEDSVAVPSGKGLSISRLTKEEFDHCHETPVRIGRYTEDSWQR